VQFLLASWPARKGCAGFTAGLTGVGGYGASRTSSLAAQLPARALMEYDFAAIAALVVFLLSTIGVLALVLRPVYIRVPWRSHRVSIHVHYCWVPVVGAMVMLALGVLDGDAVLKGLGGEEHLEPYAILVSFAHGESENRTRRIGHLSWAALTRRRKVGAAAASCSRQTGVALRHICYADEPL
jgi:hypothetical protein